jgi:hypothetical protein
MSALNEILSADQQTRFFSLLNEQDTYPFQGDTNFCSAAAFLAVFKILKPDLFKQCLQGLYDIGTYEFSDQHRFSIPDDTDDKYFESAYSLNWEHTKNVGYSAYFADFLILKAVMYEIRGVSELFKLHKFGAFPIQLLQVLKILKEQTQDTINIKYVGADRFSFKNIDQKHALGCGPIKIGSNVVSIPVLFVSSPFYKDLSKTKDKQNIKRISGTHFIVPTERIKISDDVYDFKYIDYGIEEKISSKNIGDDVKIPSLNGASKRLGRPMSLTEFQKSLFGIFTIDLFSYK